MWKTPAVPFGTAGVQTVDKVYFFDLCCKSLAEFRRPQTAEEGQIVFSGGVYVGKHTSQATSVRAKASARSGLHPLEKMPAFLRSVSKFFDTLNPRRSIRNGGGFMSCGNAALFIRRGQPLAYHLFLFVLEEQAVLPAPLYGVDRVQILVGQGGVKVHAEFDAGAAGGGQRPGHRHHGGAVSQRPELLLKGQGTEVGVKSGDLFHLTW